MPPMIGRKSELDILIRALERARDGHGSVALIGGEAGIGKTTLAGELRSAAQARNVEILWGRTPEAAWAGPYAPWIEALGNENEELFQAPDALSPDDRQVHIHDRVLRTLNRPSPTMLVLEDLHWAQPASLELLRHAAFGASRSAILIAGTYRSSAAAPHLPLGKLLGHLRREADVLDVPLSGLDRSDLRTLLGKATSDQLDRILQETKGNPLYAVELGRMLDEQPATYAGQQVPLTLRQAIAQRLDRLPDTTQQMLSTASI
ncbi:MAG TPA: AAA family ATPase, partial [Thermomicrobiales bacterium]|nr:AAA family ATPase [Thermomicrobiales bacterium]